MLIILENHPRKGCKFCRGRIVKIRFAWYWFSEVLDNA